PDPDPDPEPDEWRTLWELPGRYRFQEFDGAAH
ncbi:unnamed protein product, partial [marine sediment metagenome]